MGGYIVEYQSASSDISQSMAANETVSATASAAITLKRCSRRMASQVSPSPSWAVDRRRSCTARPAQTRTYTMARAMKKGTLR